MTKMWRSPKLAMDANRVLEQWYKRNPDDAREYDAAMIFERFKSEGVTRQEAEEMYRKIQKDTRP